MSEEYARNQMKVSVAKMLQTIGWNSIHTTPLEILTDIATQYVTQLAKSTHDYANEFGCVDPNLDHLGLAFRESHVNLSELEEYVTYVNFGQPPTPVPKFPIPKEDNLNFLKPGSKEVVTRQVHIHEHLPPMYQINEAIENDAEISIKTEDEEIINVESTTPVFKRPAEVSPNETFKRPRLLMEEEGRPTREISSVMMTTSGYISPAREGKLPESRTPLSTIDTSTTSNINPNVNSSNNLKPNKLIKKQDKKKDKVGKELFKPLPEEKVKKVTTMKDVVKLKQMKAVHAINNGHVQANSSNNFVVNNEVKIPPPPPPATQLVNNKVNTPNKINKALAAARLKTEKLNTTITPIVLKPTPENIDKLATEPDKKKVNILKKISNVKNEKVEKLENKIFKLKEEIKQESRESSPNLIIDEPQEPNKVLVISDDITIELIGSQVNKTPDKPEKSYFDDDSPPGTPSTPKTPEMISQSPPVNKEKRKRKDKSKIKKVQKLSPTRIEPESSSFLDMERPKTPEAPISMRPDSRMLPNPFNFPLFPSLGPSLIPNSFYHPLPQMFGIGLNHPPLNSLVPPMNLMPPIKQEEPKPKSPPPTPKPVATAIVPDEPVEPAPQAPVAKPEKKKEKEHKKDKKDKIKKKNKKDKIKNKAEKKKLKEEKKDKDKIKKEKKEKKKEKEVRENLEIGIPKLTLKLGTPSPRPETPDTKKIVNKTVAKKDEVEEEKPNAEVKREMSPELAKISALVTRQPKPKTVAVNNPPPTYIPPETLLQTKKSMFKPIPKIRPKEIKKDPNDESTTVQSKYTFMPEESNDVKEEPANSTAPLQKPQPGPGRPRIHPIKQKSLKPNKHQVPVKDSEGNVVWICPACGKQDDGSPMIGCDDCDAWYHWVCVGIQVPPDRDQDWYCRYCLVKIQEVLQTDKKKKRKKREKKEH